MTEHTWEANIPRPGPDCARFADWLPLLTTFTPAADAQSHDVGGVNGHTPLGAGGMNALRAHIGGCAWCRGQLASYEATDAALRRANAVPTGVAPFLSFQSIVSRVAARDAQYDERVAPGGPTGPDMAAIFDTSTIRSEKEVRMTPNHEQKNLFDSSHTSQGAPVSHASHASYASYAPDDSGALPAASSIHSAPGARSQPRRRLIQGISALAAAVIIVALFGALFYTLGGKQRHSSTGPANHTTRYLGASGRWQVVDRFSNSDYFSVAQSNPQVIYRLVDNKQEPLQRTDDSGQTWTSLTLPTQDFPNGLQIAGAGVEVSPLNPQIVILTLDSDQSNPNCPIYVGPATAHKAPSGQLSAAIPMSGGYTCTFQYTSGDGGAHWTKLSLVDKVKLQSHYGGTVLVAGSHLFSFAQPDLNGEASQVGRLMGSADGGLTWQPVDGAIIAQGQAAAQSQFVVTPNGSTLFTVSLATTAKYGDGQTYTPYLWRSDDFGAHWTNEGVFNTPPTQPNVTGAQYTLLAASSANGQVLLYEQKPGYVPTQTPAPSQGYPPILNGLAPGDIFVSVDSGHSWNEAVNRGVPQGLNAGSWIASNAATTLSDGKVVMLFYKLIVHVSTVPNGSYESFTIKDAAYYAWQPGMDAWQQVSPTFNADGIEQQWVTPASNGQPETLWQIVTQNKTTLIEKCALT